VNSLKNKNVLILSPQPWNDLKLSKHHYASTLAEMGNNVVFLCSPEKQVGIKSTIYHPSDQSSTLMIAEYQIPIPEFVKFKFPKFYQLVNWLFVKSLLKKTFKSIDLCIDFGHHSLYKDLSKIKASKKILFPVDDFEKLEPKMRGADIGFSVSNVIVERFQAAGLNFHFINHGLAQEFIESQKNHILNTNKLERIKVGYSGNLMIPFLDRVLFKDLIEQNTNVDFHCFGKYQSDGNTKNRQWEFWLSQQTNVKLHGMLDTQNLAKNIQKMDVFILLYNPDGKNYHAENSHKILEYLSTGKVVLSTPILSYKSSTLIETSIPKNFLASFKKILQSLDVHNRHDKMQQRIEFGQKNSYIRQIERILKLI